MQNLKRNLHAVWKMTWGILPEHTNVSKLGLIWGPFIESRKCMSLKFAGELCIMTMKNGAKCEKELTFQQCKTNMTNLTNFRWALEILKKLHFNGLFLTKYVFEVKKYRGIVFDDAEDWCKILRKIWLVLSKMTRIFYQSTWKSQKWVFHGMLLSKKENVWT